MAKINSINNSSGAVTIDNGSGNTTKTQYDINNVNKFAQGVPDDSVDRFYLSMGSSPGSSNAFTIEPTGEIRKVLQPAFATYLDEWNDNTNVTGDGSIGTVSFPDEIFDQNSDYDGASTFSAPATGKYKFSVHVLLRNVTTSHTSFYIEIATSNRTYRAYTCNPGAYRISAGEFFAPGSAAVLCDMDASDTAVIKVMVSGSTKIVDIGYGYTSNASAWFSGSLVC